MHISQLFILSSRGDKLAFKDFREDVAKNSDEVFYRNYKSWDGKLNQAPRGDCPPFFIVNGIQFCYVRRRQLLFVSTSCANDSPSCTVELLDRTIAVIKDFLGVISEESIRRNFTLVYELWDEMLHLGVPQEMSTENLRPYIFHDVTQVSVPESGSESMFDRIKRVDFTDRTKSSDAAAVSIVQTDKRKNELYVDVLERIVATFDCIGNATVSEVDGAILIKSFLSGSPIMYLGLDDNISIGEVRTSVRSRYASAVMDSVSFHEDADTSRFEKERILILRPKTGETTLMRYRVTAEDHIKLPFRLMQSMQLLSDEKAEVTIRVQAEYPVESSAIGTKITIPLPRSTVSATLGVGGSDQTSDYSDALQEIQWCIPQFTGGTEQVCRVRFTTSGPITPTTRREIGSISMYFEIQQHSVAGVRVKSLDLEERSESYNPSRWIRQMTQASSYVFRTH